MSNKNPLSSLFASKLTTVFQPTAQNAARLASPNGTYRCEDDTAKAGRAEQESRQTESEEAKKQRLTALGVDLERIGAPEKVIHDVNEFLDEFAPVHRSYFASMTKIDYEFTYHYPNLTKAGKIPKNVLEVSLVIHTHDYYDSDPECDDEVIAHVKYLASGEVNMIDAYLWHDNARRDVSIRREKESGQHTVTYVGRFDAETGMQESIYHKSKS